MALKCTITLSNLAQFFNRDFAALVDIAALAESCGVDQIMTSDHLILKDQLEQYRHGKEYPWLHYDWLDPIAFLSAIAARTKHVTLSSSIMIAPLRPAVLLAKQLATLDQLSRGRVEIGLGVGWLKAEYDAAGISWEKRFHRMDEQISACRALWSEQQPVSFQGDTVQFDRVYAYPAPLRPNSIKIWLGVGETDAQFKRIAAYADGWIPAPTLCENAAVLKPEVDRLKGVLAAAGRDVSAFSIRAMLIPDKKADGSADFAATIARFPQFAAAGATHVALQLAPFINKPADIEPTLRAFAEAAHAV